jgi:transcriptional regulator with XRE-family HTH domain
MSTVGQRIVKAREALGWKRPKLAEEAGVPYPTLAGLENGDQQSSTHIPAIAAATGVSALWLATGRGAMKPTGGDVASQSARPDPAIIIQTLDFLEKAFGAIDKKFVLRQEADLFADAYEWLAEDDRPVDQRNLADFAAWRAKQQVAKAGGSDEDEGRGTTRKAS